MTRRRNRVMYDIGERIRHKLAVRLNSGNEVAFQEDSAIV
jgi:hypothetical protein